MVKAISKVADHPVELVCAGRTDAGVHASYQVVHFDTPSTRNLRAWVMGINTGLPPSISVHWAGSVSDDFHARFSATYRRYRYVLFNHPVRPGILRSQVSWNFRPMNAAIMNQAAQALLGEHDFSAFRAAGCQSKTPNRRLDAIEVKRFGDYLVLDVRANAFLHHMVRNIAGALMAVGCGKRPEHWVREILAGKDRTLAGVTAPPQGLYLVDVGYPKGFDIPLSCPGPGFVRPWLS